MRIRDAVPDDAAGIQRVSARSSRAAYEDSVDDEAIIELAEDPGFRDRIRRWLAETAAADRVVYLVAEADDRLIGFAQFVRGEHAPDHVDADEVFLKSLYVHPDCWNDGVGSALLERGIAELPGGTSAVSLGVLADNDRARSFYESHGFARTGDGSYDVEDVTYETARYTLQLDGSGEPPR